MSNSTYKTACQPYCSIGNYHMYTNEEIGSQRIRSNTTSSLPMFKLSRTWCHACLTILHIIQTSKNHNPGFERRIPPIFSLLPSELRAICYQIAATSPNSPNSPLFLMCLSWPYRCSNSQRTGCHALLWFSTSIKPVRIITPKFWLEIEITRIFPRYSPLNLEQFGVLNDTHALQKVPHNSPRLPTTKSIPRLTHLQMLPATYSYTHHKKTLRIPSSTNEPITSLSLVAPRMPILIFSLSRWLLRSLTPENHQMADVTLQILWN